MSVNPHGEFEPLVTCWQCGGEGRIAGVCIDGACLDQDDPDCEFCSSVCDVCDGDGAYPDPEDNLE